MPTSVSLTVELEDRADSTDICNVCPHLWEEHDAIGARYCTATTASALPRGCVCS